MRRRVAIALLLVVPIAAACGPSSRRYRCEGGTVFTAEQRGDAMRLTLPDTTVSLARVESADGVHYGDADYSFWPKGDSALVMRGDLVVFRHCIPAD